MPVETTMRLPEGSTGTRWASMFPVTVPASTMRWRYQARGRLDGFGHLHL